ncbi:dihydrolipoyl dehydrogenase [Microlunatus endophyticus]|uniref:Dihydrolipoyl dehydrogenase n=2 Tax=Microlunatus endophyticus TaxID=1716077 RepID=A0A917S1A7_9ACTN|nr:dihydrolipoyl dehydrogenase [Microlunatus endophyticus]GGL48091.1 dihydrolipoyl dehydrogenase [Microlunatus endophyticus]
MAAMSQHDLIIVGAGSGGYACALRAAELGLRPVLVEEDLVGGTCLHRGCIPTKAVLHAAEIADAARDSTRFGVHATLERVDLGEVRNYADSVVGRLHKGLTGLIKSRSIEVVRGRGALETGPDAVEGQPTRPPMRRVRVGEQILQAPYVVLATGSSPRSLPGLEIDGTRVLTSDHALRLTELPTSAIVLGGGVIGVEFASAWRSFGVEVTVVEALPRLVPNEEPEISQALQRAFRRRGIKTLIGKPMESVRVDESVTVSVSGGTEVSADILLVAVGRAPDRTVRVDERLQTEIEGVYAVGDLVPGLQLAHRGFAHGIFVAEEIASLRDGTPSPTPVLDQSIPRVTYSDPEIAAVGLGEAAARERYGDIETFTYELAGNGRSQILGTQGFVKVVRRANGPVLGIHLIGARVGELVGEAQLITNWEAYPQEVAGLIHAHPTQSEALGEAHLALAGKPLHVHG